MNEKRKKVFIPSFIRNHRNSYILANQSNSEWSKDGRFWTLMEEGHINKSNFGDVSNNLFKECPQRRDIMRTV